ncbi:FtsH-binding integral membrane protein [Azospirillum canadense]|nr:FtsH-binding integral membrane protein [Azospirillum canadense]
MMGAVAVLKPGRPITHIYRDATRDWWAGVPVYTDGIHGFLYFPSSAVLNGPLAALPLGICDQVWRLALVLVFSTAVFRAASVLRPDAGARTASWVLALAIPTASINVLRGQWELMMLAVVMHAAVDIARERNRRGGALLALAVALKPLALVPALLFGALRPEARLPLLLGIAAAFVVPFLHPDPAYVAGQYVAMIAKLTTAAAPDSGRWFDLSRLLTEIGLHPDYALMTRLRVAAAVLTLVAAWAASRRLDRPTASLVTLMLAVFYLVLFNPRTEEGSYLNVAALVALTAFAEIRQRPGSLVPALLLLAVFGLGAHFYGDWVYRPTQMWLKQTVTLLLYGYPALAIATRRSLFDAGAQPVASGERR